MVTTRTDADHKVHVRGVRTPHRGRKKLSSTKTDNIAVPIVSESLKSDLVTRSSTLG